jgi:DNA-binding transcriptional LysR family regulator
MHKWDLSGPEGQSGDPLHAAIYHHRYAGAAGSGDGGVGVVQLPILMVKDQLATGELVRVLDAWEPRREVIHAVYPSRRGLLPSVRTLVDFLTEEYARMVEE